MMSEQDKQALEDFLKGKDNERGAYLFNQWYHAFPEPEVSPVSDAQLQTELSRIKGQRPATTLGQTWWRLAAAVAAIALVAFASFLYWSPTTAAEDWLVTQVTAGKKIQVTLADGTSVYINAGSTLRYPRTFTGSKREVYLEGEAFFDVTRDETKPFIIHTAALHTQVLGTSFNIRAYAGTGREEVTVATGKVKVSPAQTTPAFTDVQLTPGQSVVYQPQRQVITRRAHIQTENIAGWRTGRLVFDDATVEEILITLRQQFNVDIQTSDTTLSTQHVTAAFDPQPLTRIMDLLAVTLNTCHTRQGNTIVLGGAPCTIPALQP